MSSLYKLTINVPVSHVELVRKAIGDAGAGRAGKYSHCSFTVEGVGRFTPLAGANPHIGSVGQPEEVSEHQIQTVVAHDDLKAVLAAMRASHPYEEIGYEVCQMVDESLL